MATEAATEAGKVVAEKAVASVVAARVLVDSMEAGAKAMEEPGEVEQAVAALVGVVTVEEAVLAAEAVGQEGPQAVLEDPRAAAVRVAEAREEDLQVVAETGLARKAAAA